MGKQTQVTTGKAPQNDNPYSQGILVNGFLFVSGFGPVDPETGSVITGDIGEQTHRVMENLRAVVKEAGGTLDDVVKATVYLTDIDDYDAVNQAYAEHLGDIQPARVCIEAAKLPDDVDVEIDAIAVVD